MAEYVKQPNGKYCRISCGSISEFNLTEQDIIKSAVVKAEKEEKEAIQNAKPCGEIISSLALRIQTPRIISKSKDDLLKEMGFKDSYSNLVKYVPMKPIGKTYASCDFTTYGKCPSCGKTVQDGIGFKEEKCKCGQILKWD